MVTSTTHKILIINPNSSTSMSEGIQSLIRSLNAAGSTSSMIDIYTAPSGPPSINNEEDSLLTTKIVYSDLLSTNKISQYDAILVACYSVHPLVHTLQENAEVKRRGIHVTGIFEASISTSLALTSASNSHSKFGIVTTGTYWEKVLSQGVQQFLDIPDLKDFRKFKGVQSTSLNADELHTAPPALVRERMMDATRRLVKEKDVKVVCLGCAGMAGLDGIVREALVAELGEEAGYVHILDGVKAGVGVLEGLLRALPPVKRDG
ncbi:hypothetical protein HYALB_00010220 [Hymenoscyphus albidus]|uniref:Hydantoin racemase n=1 Tax=Hymenoscyphus albidus TaxID=595503 RepID=A0A9N9PXA0_9HELO|nr:hypothetical protein HYALB_00010220 [Hymenoscyphus albidus]